MHALPSPSSRTGGPAQRRKCEELCVSIVGALKSVLSMASAGCVGRLGGRIGVIRGGIEGGVGMLQNGNVGGLEGRLGIGVDSVRFGNEIGRITCDSVLLGVLWEF